MLVGYELNEDNQVICWYWDNLDDLEVQTLEVNNNFRNELGNKQYKIINDELVRDTEKEDIINRIIELETQEEPVTTEEYLERLENDMSETR